MRRWMAVSMGALMLAGCIPRATGPRPQPPLPPDTPETISYETGPCFGACPVYRVTVSANGDGVFNGMRFTPVTGELHFKVSPQQFAAFKAALAPYRPATGNRRIATGSPDCSQNISDMASVDVHWQGPKGAQELYFYYGCAADHRAMADALGNAPDALPIAAWIGAQP